MAKPSPWPWKIEDNERRSYKIVAKDGTVVCYIHYPKNLEQGMNCRVVERAAEVYDKFKQQQLILEALVRAAGRNPETDAFILAAKKLIDDVEIRPAPKQPPGSV